MDNKLGLLLLRIGLAFAFFYAAVSALITPESWAGWVPQFIARALPFSVDTFLAIHSVGEIALGIWLLSGWRTFWAALLSAGALFTIVVFNLGGLLIVFRDVSLTFAALALAAFSYPFNNERRD